MNLLDLPPELRNHIYHFLFTPPTTPSFLFSSNPPLPPPASTLLRPLLTCRLLHAEAAPLAYASVPFTTHSAAPLFPPTSSSTPAHSPSSSSSSSSPPSSPSPIPSCTLSPTLGPSVRHIVLRAKITHLRPLAEAWAGQAFGHAALRLATLTILPQRPAAFGAAAASYAEVAALSQAHTLAFVVAEMVVALERGAVRKVVVRDAAAAAGGGGARGGGGGSGGGGMGILGGGGGGGDGGEGFDAETWHLVYRSLVYRLWRGQRRPASGEWGFREGEGEFNVWMGDGAGKEGRGLEAEFRWLAAGGGNVVGVGGGTSSAAGWGYVAMQ
ncbi:MAG: hypothetical protein M1821_008126 [Bathelium mastoideum]|nr:MAG: hypothetical protein M1821_008126 [Bathelium mastoideum]